MKYKQKADLKKKKEKKASDYRIKCRPSIILILDGAEFFFSPNHIRQDRVHMIKQ